MRPSVQKLSPIIQSKNGFEVYEMRPRGSRTAKICSSVAVDFSPLVTLDFELVLKEDAS